MCKAAVYTGTRNLYGDMATAAKSLIANSDVDEVWLLIEDGKFPDELPHFVKPVDVSGQELFPPDGANGSTPYSYMTLMRCALALMPEFDHLDRIVSLDCDTVCVRDASALWDTDLGGAYFAAAQESWALSRPGLDYCNVGVTLHNLDALRDGKAQEVVGLLNSHYYRWPDQDAMNYTCQGRIAKMPPEYNWCPWIVGHDRTKPRIIHYAARDDWRDEAPAAMYRAMTWDEALERHGRTN